MFRSSILAIGRLSLRAKVKILLTSYQVISRIQTIYAVPWPPSVAALFAWMGFLSLDVDGIGVPFRCLGLDGFFLELLFFYCLPFALVLLAPPCYFVLRCRASYPSLKKRLIDALVRALPAAILIIFLTYSMVASLA